MSTAKKLSVTLAAALLTTIISAPSFAEGPSNTSVHVNGSQNAGFISFWNLFWFN